MLNLVLHFDCHSLILVLPDEKTISACLYQFAIIGEATRHIDYEILEKHTYPWYKIKAFRNFILHEYHGIEMKVVWDAAINFLPDLKEVMERILREEF